jgi:type I restriction enzyme M protein
MNRDLIAEYIAAQPIRVVESLDLANNKVKYGDGIKQRYMISEIKGEESEELVRAYFLTRLVNELGYAPERIELEHEYTAGRPKKILPRIDVIVRDENEDAFMFIEMKRPSEYSTGDKEQIIQDQLFRLAGMERTEGRKVKYLVLYTLNATDKSITDECIIIDFEKYPTFDDWVASDRESTNELPSRYGRAQKRPYIKASDKDLETDFTHDFLNRLQTDLHNVLWGGGGTDDNEIFASLTNLILAKIQDEDEKEDGAVYDFQSLMFEKDDGEEYETSEQLFERINELYRRALKAKLYISDDAELRKSYVIDTKKFSLSKLKYTVQKLESLSFVNGRDSLSEKDILGDFFEGIVRSGFKQTKGQFFTHINIVRFMLWGLQADELAIKRINKDKEIPYMIDPSAGSGTFLLEYMKFITQNIKYRFKDQILTARVVKDKIERWFYPNHHENIWAKDYIYACEINFNLGTAIKVNMILHGDGSTNVFVKDGLLPFMRYVKESALNQLNTSVADSQYNKINVNEHFDLILTNPPFSVEFDNDTKKTLSKGFMFGEKKNSENLFIERWYQLLRENGRLAAVLPESVFDTTENKYIRLFIYKYFKIKAIVSLPELAFKPFTSTKTSILFAQKKTAGEIAQWNTAWDKASKEYSKLKTRVENIVDVYDGKKVKANLPSIQDLTQDEETQLLKAILKYHLSEQDSDIDTKGLMEKYRNEIKLMCSTDKDTSDAFGRVNTWWVFGEVVKEINYPVLMAEADNVGYKRSAHGEKEMPNDLFDLEYAPTELDVDAVESSYETSIAQLVTAIEKRKSEMEGEKDKAKIEYTREVIERLSQEKAQMENDKEDVMALIGKFYFNGKLMEEYAERTEETLIREFRSGRLSKWRSEQVALRKTEKATILDYMRMIDWD